MKRFRFSMIAMLLIGIFQASFAQDWANLERFEADNTKVEMSKDSVNRVVFMGNSITEGWLNQRPEFFTGKPFVNRGISGQTTPQMLIRFRQDVIDLSPEVVVILAGINDIAGNTGPSTIEMITDNIYSMAEIASANGIKVILSSVLPAYDFPWRPGLKPAIRVVVLNKHLKAYAEEKGHIYLDYFTPMVNDNLGLKEDLGDDGIHPNAKGYLIMEPLVEAAIKKALKH